MKHVRHVHRHKAEIKIVCCEPGMECLYPSAFAFFYDYVNPIPDEKRCCCGTRDNDREIKEYRRSLHQILRKIYPGHLIDDLKYDCPWHLSDSVKFQPVVYHYLPKVDIAIAPRKRQFVPDKNWQHWPMFVNAMHQNGLSVGLCGGEDTSFDMHCMTKAWKHNVSACAGTVDLLNHCKWFVGSDSGVALLAALMDVNSVLFRHDSAGNPDMTTMMKRASKGIHIKLPDEVWHKPNELIERVLKICKP